MSTNIPNTGLAQGIGHPLAPIQKTHLQVLSNSAMACYRRCAREFQYRYIMLRRPRRSSDALRFGTFFHIGLNAWWGVVGDAGARLLAALDAMSTRALEKPEDTDEFDLVKAEELMIGYTARWDAAEYETVGVEVPFTAPLINPATGKESRTYVLQGKIDVIVKKDGRLYQIEHKTSSEDIGLGSDYWRMVSALDPQVSTYLTCGRAAGYDLDSCVYDVVRKVALRPGVATPEEKRSYTKEKSKQCPLCKKGGTGPHVVEDITCAEGRLVTDPGGKLHANQRENDETAEEFRLRTRENINERPDRYFARGPIVRLDHDEREHAGDVWQTAWFIREATNANRFPRNPGSCRRYGRLCEYFDVCSGLTSIGDDIRFRTASTAHEELAEI